MSSKAYWLENRAALVFDLDDAGASGGTAKACASRGQRPDAVSPCAVPERLQETRLAQGRRFEAVRGRRFMAA
jgi:hypothetical protein